ncbi:MAG: hypothetical protein PUC12_07325, partial [Clostridiales bacterium]|nr:hypothetical protein [Clostridiales bacterium]
RIQSPYIPATRPRLGTIMKNHIQSSPRYSELLFLFALNMILHLRIIPFTKGHSVRFSYDGMLFEGRFCE